MSNKLSDKPYLTNNIEWFIMDSVPNMVMNKKTQWKWKQRLKDKNVLFAHTYRAKASLLTELVQNKVKQWSKS